MKKCTKCNKKIKRGEILGCPNCGTNYCSNCGTTTLKICPKCYHNLEYIG